MTQTLEDKPASRIPNSTDQKVLQIREQSPELPAVKIAEMLSLSRERVRQILNEFGLPTKIPRDYGLCAYCNGQMSPGQKRFCSAECRSESIKVTFICDYCQQPKKVIRSVYKASIKRGYKHMYCSKDCRNHGKWLYLKTD
jgi:hypothetical protein